MRTRKKKKKKKKRNREKSDVRGEEVGWKEHGRMMELRLPSAGR